MKQKQPEKTNPDTECGQLLKCQKGEQTTHGGHALQNINYCLDTIMKNHYTENMRCSRMHRQTFLLVLIATISSFSLHAGTPSSSISSNTPAEAFKRYFSEQPKIKRMIVTSYAKEYIQGKYVIAVDNQSFYVRHVKNEEDYDAPVSKTNRVLPGFMAGRNANESWSINGFGVSKYNIREGDPAAKQYIQMAQMERSVTINRMISMGVKYVTLGTAVWQDNHFTISNDPGLVGGVSKTYEADVAIQNNRVIQLTCLSNKTELRYEYSANPKLPVGFPSRVYQKSSNEWILDLEYHEVEFFDRESSNDNIFLAESHILPEVALITIYSNNLQTNIVTKTSRDALRFQNDTYLKTYVHDKKTLKAIVTCAFVVLVISVPFILKLLYKKIQNRKIK